MDSGPGVLVGATGHGTMVEVGLIAVVIGTEVWVGLGVLTGVLVATGSVGVGTNREGVGQGHAVGLGPGVAVEGA